MEAGTARARASARATRSSSVSPPRRLLTVQVGRVRAALPEGCAAHATCRQRCVARGPRHVSATCHAQTRRTACLTWVSSPTSARSRRSCPRQKPAKQPSAAIRSCPASRHRPLAPCRTSYSTQGGSTHRVRSSTLATQTYPKSWPKTTRRGLRRIRDCTSHRCTPKQKFPAGALLQVRQTMLFSATWPVQTNKHNNNKTPQQPCLCLRTLKSLQTWAALSLQSEALKSSLWATAGGEGARKPRQVPQNKTNQQTMLSLSSQATRHPGDRLRTAQQPRQGTGRPSQTAW